MKVYLDNNFFTNYESCADESYKKSLKDAFVSHRFSSYISYELLSEAIGIARLGIDQKLKERLSLISDILSGRVFNSYGKIIQTELGLTNNETLFVPTVHITKRLKDISNGLIEQNQIDILLAEDERQKKEHFEYYKKQQILIKQSKRIKQENQISFEEFKKRNKNHMLNFIKKILKENDNLQLDSRANDINNNIACYKYFNTFLNTIMSLHYKYFEQNLKVENSDFFDALHLIYLTELDAIFTDDRRMRNLTNLVFGNQIKVIYFTDIKQYL